MVTNRQYQEIKTRLTRTVCPSNLLDRLKTKYNEEIASNRRLEECNTLEDFLALLQKRALISENNINILEEIARLLGIENVIGNGAPIPTNNFQAQGSELIVWMFLLWSIALLGFDSTVCWLCSIVSSVIKFCCSLYEAYVVINIQEYVRMPLFQFVEDLPNEEVNSARFVLILYYFALSCLCIIKVTIYIIKLLVVSRLMYIHLYIRPFFSFLFVKYKVSISQAKNHLHRNRHLLF